MAAAQGYIGRNPADSSTVIARQSFSPTGIQTDFTFAAGYEVGYVDLYLNGARLIEGQDFTATDGSTVGLTTNAVNGDVLEVVAFKAFNASNVSAAAGNFTVGGTLDVTGATTLSAALSVSGNTTVGTGITLDTNGNVNVSGVLTANSFVGDGTQLTGVGGGSVISGITIREEGSVVGTSGTVVNVNFVGADVTATAQAGFSTITIAGGGKFINFTDGGSTGITTTAKTKIDDDFNVTGVGTFASRVSVGDSIFHVGDDNTAIGFPAADTFTVYTAGSEALRVTGIGSVGIGTNNPGTVLDVRAGNWTNGDIVVGEKDNAGRIKFRRGGDGSDTGSIGFAAADNNSRLAINVASGDGTIAFETNTNEALRIDSSQRLLIGTESSQDKWNNSSGDHHLVQIESTSAFSQSWISHSTSSTAGVQLDIGRSRGSSDGDTTVVNDGDLLGHLCFQGADGSQFVRGARIFAIVNGTPTADDMPTDLVFETNSGSSNSAERLRINSGGDVNITGITTASQFDATSDVSLKENIEVIDEPITKLSELKGVTFDWKKGGHSVGVIAQDVEKVLPTAVGGSKDQKTVNYNAIIGLLVESVKDQQKQIEELKSLLDK